MPGCAPSPRCPAPTQTSREKALLQLQELVGDTWHLPPRGWEPISTPWCWLCDHSELGSISRCPNLPDVVPPLLLSAAGTTLRLWALAVAPSLTHGKWPAQAGDSFWQGKSGFTNPPGTDQPSGPMDSVIQAPCAPVLPDPRRVIFRPELNLLVVSHHSGHQFCPSLVGNESAVTNGGQSLHGVTGGDELFPFPSSPQWVCRAG